MKNQEQLVNEPVTSQEGLDRTFDDAMDPSKRVLAEAKTEPEFARNDPYERGMLVESEKMAETTLQRPPTALRDAEGGHLVVVPRDFAPSPIKPVEIVQVSFHDFDEDHHETFLVDASILDDPMACKKFFAEILKTYGKGSFDWKRTEDFSSVGIFTVEQMKREVQKLGKQPFLLQDHIARNSITLMVGDSGLGKSPFNYELGICIASGMPFLGIPTVQGRVLYLDYEDDTDQMIVLAETISNKLCLPGPPDTFRFWSPSMNESGSDPFELIQVYRPDLVIIDTISTADPKAETENRFAAELYKRCRETGAAVLFVHHLKKDTKDENDSSFDLDLDRPTTVRDFQGVRGASALYNNAYLRLKLIRAPKNDEDWAFIVRGYRRGKGAIPTISVGRVLDNNGEPIGHYRLGGLARLSPRHREVFTALPDRFRWKDLAEHFKGNGSKQVFVTAAESAKVLSSKREGDHYVKHPNWKTL